MSQTESQTAPTPVSQAEVDVAAEILAPLLIELRGRGKQLPMGQLKMECLLDMILPEGSQERVNFDLRVIVTAVETARSMLAAARRDELLKP